jgi:hypothetical protein
MCGELEMLTKKQAYKKILTKLFGKENIQEK